MKPAEAPSRVECLLSVSLSHVGRSHCEKFPRGNNFYSSVSDSRGFCSCSCKRKKNKRNRLISTKKKRPVRLSAILTAKKTIKKVQAVSSFEHLPQNHGAILTDTRSSQRLALKFERSNCLGSRPFDQRLQSFQPVQLVVRRGWAAERVGGRGVREAEGGGRLSRRCLQQVQTWEKALSITLLCKMIQEAACSSSLLSLHGPGVGSQCRPWWLCVCGV